MYGEDCLNLIRRRGYLGMMGLQFCDGRVAGLALRSQTQIREPHHANLTFEFSRFTECCSRVLRCLSSNPNRIPRDNVCAEQPCLETTIVGLEDDRADVAAVATVPLCS